MTDGPTYGFDTLQIHAGARPDPATGARQTPIYQTTAYVFRDAEHAAALFNLQEVGFIYSRLTNPTVAVLQERIATLEGGVGAVCCSSGHAAQIMALFPIMGPGKNVVVSTRLYGGTVTQFSQTIKRFGWSATFVDFDDLDAVKAAIDDDTRAVFCEAIANPGGYITDVPAIAAIAGEDFDPSERISEIVRKKLGIQFRTKLLSFDLEFIAGLTPDERLALTKRIQDAGNGLGQFMEANLAEFDTQPSVWMPMDVLP